MLTYKKKLFFSYIIFITISFILVYNLLTTVNTTTVQNIAKENLKQKADERLEFFNDFFKPYFTTIQAVSENQTFKEYIEKDIHKKHIQEYFLSIKKSLPCLLQIRYLDIKGNELIRIEGNPLLHRKPSSYITDESKLQNKAHRYYVQEFLNLEQNKIGISNVDLNIENNKVEASKKPVVRFGMAVYDEAKNKKGILVINICLRTLYAKLNKATLFHTHIIDNTGKFLFHNNQKYGITGETLYTIFDSFPQIAQKILQNNIYQDENIYSTHVENFPNNQDLKIILENKYSKDIEISNTEQSYFIIIGILFALITLPLVLYFSKKPDDLEAQLKIQDELSQKNIFITTILKNAPIPMYYKDLDGVFLNINDKFTEIFGVQYNDVINKKAFDFLNYKMATTFHQKDEELKNSDAHTQVYQGNIQNQNTGSLNTVEFHKNILFNAKGKQVGIIGSIYDITDSLNLRNELIHLNKHLNEKVKFQTQEIRDKMKVITNNVIYSKTDTSGFIIDVSEAFCKLSGYSKEELVGSPHSIIRHPDTPIETFIDLWSHLKNEKPWRGEIKNRKKDGSSYWVYSDIQAKYDNDGNLTGYISVRSDITDRKKVENQQLHILEQSKMAAMGEMLGNIAHQWRQPLSVITTVASGVSFKNEYGSLKLETLNKDMDNIVDSAQYLSDTIETFRNFLKEKKELKEICIQDRIKDVLHILSATIKNNNIKIINNTFNTNPIHIHMVSGELDQVLINIINNSKDIFIEKDIKEACIEIDLEQIDNKIILSIEDNGGGVPTEIMPRIFEAYYTTKHKSKGTGLGLNMSYRIISESLKGKLYVKNTDKGAKFFIEIPIEQ